MVGGYNNCDLFYTYKTSDGWSDVMAFDKKINRKDSWESQHSVSADGNSIIFASDRSGGYGKIDLYESLINIDYGELMLPYHMPFAYDTIPRTSAIGDTLYNLELK